MIFNRREIGKLGEDIACKYLLKKKYKILKRNHHSRFGEIDVIAEDNKGYLVFFEVKTRASSKYGQGYESVDYYKQQKLVKTAYIYLSKNKIYNNNFRIDVLSIYLDFKKRIAKITHFRNAIGEDI